MKEISLCVVLLKNWKTTLEELKGRKRVCVIGEKALVFFFLWDYFTLSVCFSKCLS